MNSSSANSSSANSSAATNGLAVFVPEVVRTIPHDTSAFTEGLCFWDGGLYESAGEYARSTLRQIDPATGKVQRLLRVPPEYFAEGFVIHNGLAYQLTYREHTCLVYDAKTFKQVKSFPYYGEGWGLTTNGTELIMSDGSNVLRVLDPATFSVKRTLFVTAPMSGGAGAVAPVNQLNELEFMPAASNGTANDEIWANVWYSDSVACIHPQSGNVLRWLDMSSLGTRADRTSSNAVLNGIAHNPSTNTTLFTGKNWSHLYEVRLRAATQQR
jgi:glutaminyl-peptide cyclotransferase